MKLLIILYLKEELSLVRALLKEAGSSVVTEIPATGIKLNQHEKLATSWIGHTQEEADVMVAISFTTEDTAQRVIKEIENENKRRSDFPLHGFIMCVEDMSKVI
ncbi:MAG: hypothetical protein ACRC6R_00185 [Bacteroidales bacterium]